MPAEEEEVGGEAAEGHARGERLWSVAELWHAQKRARTGADVEEAEETEVGEGDQLVDGEHPYGVRPEGNLLALDAEGQTRRNVLDTSLGSLRRFTDAAVLAVLSRLPADVLCRVSAASRGLYVFSHHSSLWRDLTLSVHGGDFNYRGGWKQTYISRLYPSFSGHKPLRVEGCYSDVLYDPWMNSALQIDPTWLMVDNVQRRAGLTPEDFVRNFETPGIPVILTDVMKSWAGVQEWKAERLREKYADTMFRVSATTDMRLADFLDYCERSSDERPLYLFDRHYSTKCPDMQNEYAIPPHFRDDLMSVLGNSRPDYRWLIMGPARSGSSFHVDPNCNFAWNATVQGRKKWILYPPHIKPPLDDDEVSLLQWFVRHYHEDHESKCKRLECVTQAGELMYVPRGWWHCVLNLEFSIALTHNVVTQRNLVPVLDFLAEGTSCDPGQGCRGDIAINVSGDVPPSVIFPPFKKNKKANRAEACRCFSQRLKLLSDLEDGLARYHPGLVHRLKEERQRQRNAAKSSWADLNLFPAPSSSPGDSAQTFSFGF
jgi:hypothetical protein